MKMTLTMKQETAAHPGKTQLFFADPESGVTGSNLLMTGKDAAKLSVGETYDLTFAPVAANPAT